MFQTMQEIVGKLMGDERMAEAMADLAILRDETASIETQWTARNTELATLQEQHNAMMDQMKAEAAQMQQDFESKFQMHLATESEMQAKIGAAVQAYKKATLAANPEIPADMMADMGHADSIDAVDTMMTKAKAHVDQIKASLGVPGGAPARNRIDVASMSSLEKIRHAISQ